jgi:hypothetical protein
VGKKVPAAFYVFGAALVLCSLLCHLFVIGFLIEGQNYANWKKAAIGSVLLNFGLWDFAVMPASIAAISMVSNKAKDLFDVSSY